MDATDATEAGPAGLDTEAVPDTETDGQWLAIGAAADRLGTSTATLRKRAQRASVLAKKDADGQWVIFVPDATSAATTSGHGTSLAGPSAGQLLIGLATSAAGSAGPSGPDAELDSRAVGSVELARVILEQQQQLAKQAERNARQGEAIAALGRDLATASASAAMWQERAAALGQRIAMLEAGPIPPTAASSAGTGQPDGAGQASGVMPDNEGTTAAISRPRKRDRLRRWLTGGD